MVRLQPKRFVRALVLTALLWLASTTLVVSAASDEAAEALLVPEPRPGDRATYRVSQVILDGDVALGDLRALNEATFEWQPEVLVTTPDFGARSAHPLRSAYAMGDKVYDHEAGFDAISGAPLYDSAAATTATGDGTDYGLLLEDLIGSEGSSTDWHARWYTGPLGPCGVRPAFTTSPERGDIVAIPGHCAWPGAPDVVQYRADGWRADDGRSFRFTSLEDKDLHIWYDGRSPFPVRVESPLTDTVYRDYTYGRMFVLERIAYERGDEPYPTPRTGAGPGPAELAARPDWGLSDDGVDLPFTLSAAHAAALAEEDLPNSSTLGTDPTVPDFQATHPGTYLGYASYTDLVDQQGNHHYTWWLIFTDGAARLGKRVELGPLGFSSVFLPPGTGNQVYVYDWEPDASYAPADVRGLFPPATILPAQMPTAASAMERYAVTSGQVANSYGFQLRCATATCGGVRAEVVAGFSAGDLYGAANVLGGSVVEHSSTWDSVWIDADGRLSRTYTAVTASETPFPVVKSASGEEPAAAPQSATWAPATWTPTTQAAAAGLGLLAILAGALYYLWPAAKGALGAGLFSRIEQGDVLDNPTRRLVHDAIGAEPGIHFQALARKTGLGRGNLDHHVRKLVAADLVTVRRAPGYTCFFAKGAVGRQMADAAPALRSGGSRAVFDAVAQHPGTSSRDLAVQLGMAPSTVSYHLSRLHKAGLVVPAPGSGVHLTPLGIQAASGVATTPSGTVGTATAAA